MNQSGGVQNPCINICRMDHNGTFCQGCWRTVLEIGLWDQMNDEQKAAVTELLEHRRSVKVSRLASPGDATLENGVPQ